MCSIECREQNFAEFCFSSALIVKIIKVTWSAVMLLNFLIKSIDGSLLPSVPMETVLDAIVAGWFVDLIY